MASAHGLRRAAAERAVKSPRPLPLHATAAEARAALAVTGPPATSCRYSDRPPAPSARIGGVAATALVCFCLIGTGLLRWAEAAPPRTEAATLTLIEVAPPRAPPAPPSERASGPEHRAMDASPPSAPRATAAAADTTAPPLPAAVPLLTPAAPAAATGAPAPTAPSPPAQPAARATAPESRAVPSAPVASDARPKWEGLLLAALNRAKRYPRDALRKGQEGTVRIRFLVDRRGRVHAVRLIHSSGLAVLDAEALSLPARAQPLPRPPAELRGNRIELTVPIEFFLR